jgi:hypothetical protein
VRVKNARASNIIIKSEIYDKMLWVAYQGYRVPASPFFYVVYTNRRSSSDEVGGYERCQNFISGGGRINRLFPKTLRNRQKAG